MTKKYNLQEYDHQPRWLSYWYQISEVIKDNPANVLEIGIGNGTVADYLKKTGLEVTTLDIAPELKPEIVASVLKMPFKQDTFDTILCCEVLEHLPFKDFEKSLSELKRVCKKNLVLSLPHFGPPVKFSFKLPFLKERRLAFKVPYFRKHELGGEHYWEIGKRGYGVKKIKKIIKKYFEIKRDFIPYENQYHHFFILEKRPTA